MGAIFCLLRMVIWAQLRGNFGAVAFVAVNCKSDILSINIFIKNSKAAVFEEKEPSIPRSVFV